MQGHARLRLQVVEHGEQVACLRLAMRAEHADQALARCAGLCTELLGADHRLNVVAQQHLASVHVAGEQCLDALAQQRVAEGWIGRHVRLDRFLEVSCECRRSLRHKPFTPLVVGPAPLSHLDVALLTLLGTPASRMPSTSPSRPK